MSEEVEVSNFEFIKQVYRATSPTISRQENRIKELEELLDIEREARARLERSNDELEEQLESYVNQVDECSVSASQHNEAIRRRDADIQRLRNDLDKMSIQMEASEQGLRKKNHSTIMEMKSELENIQSLRLKSEKDKMVFLKELETTLIHLDASQKLKLSLEIRTENAETQLARLKAIIDEQERQMKELNILKNMSAEENASLKNSVKDVNQQNINLRKSKSSLEQQLDESKKYAEEETRMREILQSQIHQLQSDNEQQRIQLEEETENNHRIQHNLVKINGELSALRNKYEKDISERCTEFEELRRKNIVRTNELTEEATREHIRANSIEKIRQQLAMEVSDLNSELERIEADVEQLQHNVKSLEVSNSELTKEVQELDIEVTTLKMANAKLSSENSRLKMNIEEEEQKNTSLQKDNTALSGQARDLKDNLHVTTKELNDVHSIKTQLETDRNNLLTALEETKIMLIETERKFQANHNTLLQLKTDMEQRLMEKNEELESLRKTSQRTIEDLSISLSELEVKYKSEVTKLKKKYEIQNKQLQDSFDIIQRENGELTEELQETCNKLQEVENAFEEDKQELHVVQEKLFSSERRRVQLQGDLDDSNHLLEAADKSRKNIQQEIEDMNMKFAECSAQINSLVNDKRKVENEISTLKMDFEDLTIVKEESEERANRCCNKVNVLIDELKQEQESHKKSEIIRKSITQELKETKAKLEQNESSNSKDITKNTQAFQEKIRELELELEYQRSRSKESQSLTKKQDRVMKELQKQADDERNTIAELQLLLESAQSKTKTYKRQMDELEIMNAENLNRYRRAKKEIEDVQHRVAITERRTGSSHSFQGNGTSIVNISSYSKIAGAH